MDTRGRVRPVVGRVPFRGTGSHDTRRAAPSVVELETLGARHLPELLAVATTDAAPTEVMSPIPGEIGWTAAQRTHFLVFHRLRSLDPENTAERTYVIRYGGHVVGAGRVVPTADHNAEIGLWLGRLARGRGIGRIVVRWLRDLATEQGAVRVVATTTIDNVAAVSALAAAGAVLTRRGDFVDADLPTHCGNRHAS